VEQQAVATGAARLNWIDTWPKSVEKIVKSLIFLLGGRGSQLDFPYCPAWLVLAIPISTVASESAFSTCGRILDDFRSSLTPFMVEALVCTQDWL